MIDGAPRRGAALAAFLAATLATTLASACPVCAQRSDGGALGDVALGAFIVAPWIVALVVGLIIRRNITARGHWS
jgi:hypothetical protein